MRALRLLAVASTAALLTACGSNEPDEDTVLEPGPAAGSEESSPPLVGTTWTLDQVTTSSGETTPEKDAQITITEEGRLEADSGCNSYGGDAVVVDGEITLENVIGTLKACDGATGDVDRAFGTVLQGTVTAEMSDGGLTLTNAGGDALTFTASG